MTPNRPHPLPAPPAASASPIGCGGPGTGPASRRQALVALVAAGLGSLAGAAQSQSGQANQAAKGKVVLTLTGKVKSASAPGAVDFDMAMLEALPQQRFSTHTPWFKGARTFSGPLLRDVLAAAGAQGTQLQAIALNNYKVDIPADDARQHRMLVATRLDDRPMPVREKGPLFIVYPYDDDAELRSERYYNRSAWQLRTIDVK